jgi:hypothetical protein
MALPQEKLQTEPTNQPADVDITREYVVGTGAFSTRIGQILSNFTDDLQWIVGVDVYERMARDPTVSKNLQFQKLSVQSEGVQLHPVISKPKTSETDQQKLQEYQLSQDIKDFHERSLNGLHRPISQIIGEMLVALKRPNSVSEITYKEPTSVGIDAYKLLLKSIKVKPHNTTAFVIDEFRNVLGLTAWLHGRSGVLPAAKMVGGQQLVPLEKFAVLAFETEDEDPRGINPLRPAYNFWQAKCLVPGLHLKWLEKSGIPSTIGVTPQGANYEQDESGNTLTAQEVLAAKLASLESGSSIAVAFGTLISQLEVASRGEQFGSAIETFDKQIDYALGGQSGATKDSDTGSYSSKRVMKDVLDILIWSRKQCVAQVLQGVLNKGTEYNWGIEFVYLTPKVVIGDNEGRDWATDAEALTKLASILTKSQKLALLSELGVPPPEEGEEEPVAESDNSGANNNAGDTGNPADKSSDVPEY